MVNKILFKSSIILAGIHILTYIYLQPCNIILIINITIGIITSIWNHGVTCNIAKYVDRMMMIGFIINSYIISSIQHYLCMMTLFLAVVLYYLAKTSKNTLYHVGAHLILTFTHILLMI